MPFEASSSRTIRPVSEKVRMDDEAWAASLADDHWYQGNEASFDFDLSSLPISKTHGRTAG
jgi:hypothetical protein